jgi:hypothetical protein
MTGRFSHATHSLHTWYIQNITVSRGLERLGSGPKFCPDLEFSPLIPTEKKTLISH